MNKTCHLCKKDKPLIEFNKNTARKDGLQSRCKECDSKLGKKNYQEKYKKQTLERNLLRKKKLKTWFAEFKQTLKCEQCEEQKWYVLDFHHNSDKDDSVANLVNRGVSIKTILEEVAKCKVLCSNCHRELHYLERLKTSQPS